MNEKLMIGIDIDGCLFEWGKHFLECYNRIARREGKPELKEILDYDVKNPEFFDVDISMRVLKEVDYYVEFIEGMDDMITKLIAMPNVRVFTVSAKGYNIDGVTKALQSIGFKIRNMIWTKHKSWILDQFDYFVEDSTFFVNGNEEYAKNKALICETTYNQNIKDKPLFYGSHKEVAEALLFLAEGHLAFHFEEVSVKEDVKDIVLI